MYNWSFFGEIEKKGTMSIKFMYKLQWAAEAQNKTTGHECKKMIITEKNAKQEKPHRLIIR